MVDEFEYPEDINDFLMQNVVVDKGEYLVPLHIVREALEHYYYEELM